MAKLAIDFRKEKERIDTFMEGTGLQGSPKEVVQTSRSQGPWGGTSQRLTTFAKSGAMGGHFPKARDLCEVRGHGWALPEGTQSYQKLAKEP